MRAHLDTAGERLGIDSALSWVDELIAEGSDGELRPGDGEAASVEIAVEASGRPFETLAWRPLTRGAWRSGEETVLENVCTSGFDLHVDAAEGEPRFTYRWRPPVRDRAAARILRSRWHLLARAALVQYPALWCAAGRGRVPLHASAVATAEGSVLVAAAGGSGRSTIVLEEARAGAPATGDNLAVGDGTSVWGLVEPVRIEGGSGRRMAHGRNELQMPRRVAAIIPDTLVVLERGGEGEPTVEASDPVTAARSLVTSTYMAGELRRYWPFAAMLTAGTGFGPPQPPLTDVASAFASKLTCLRIVLGTSRGSRLSDLLAEATMEVGA
jgi:hypothetical protein